MWLQKHLAVAVLERGKQEEEGSRMERSPVGRARSESIRAWISTNPKRCFKQ